VPKKTSNNNNSPEPWPPMKTSGHKLQASKARSGDLRSQTLTTLCPERGGGGCSILPSLLIKTDTSPLGFVIKNMDYYYS